jgi:hypothetical protein
MCCIGRGFLSQRPMVFIRHQYAVLPVDIRYSSSTRALGSSFICLFLPIHSPISSTFDHDPFHSRFPQVFHAQIANQSNFQVKIPTPISFFFLNQFRNVFKIVINFACFVA